MQVDEHVGQGVVIGDGSAIAQFGALDAEVDSLAINALGGGALFVDLLVFRAMAVELIADARATAGGEGGDTTFLGPVLVVDGAGFAGGLREA